MGAATGTTFIVRLEEPLGGYSATKTVGGLADTISLLFTIPFDSNNSRMEGWLGNDVVFNISVDSTSVVSESNENNNTAQASIGFVDSGIPNLYVKRVEMGTPHYIGDDLITADFNVVISVEYAEATSFVVSFYKDTLGGSSITITPISQIRIGDEIKLLFRYEAPVGAVFRLAGGNQNGGKVISQAGGDEAEFSKMFFQATENKTSKSQIFLQDASLQQATDFYVFVDSQNDVDETNENDNVYQVSVQPELADLRFSEISIPATVFKGEQIAISGTIENIGETDSGGFVLGVYLNENLVGQQNIGSIAAGGSEEFTFSLASGTLPELVDVNVLIDVLGAVDEISKANNLEQARMYVVDSQAIYSYERFLALEPLWLSYWKAKNSTPSYAFSISGNNLSVLSLVTLPNFRQDQDLITTKTSSGISEVSGYVLRVDKDSQLYSLHNFDAISRSMVNSYEEINSTAVKWWVEPNFIRRMHYERINSLTLIWWQLWLGGEAN